MLVVELLKDMFILLVCVKLLVVIRLVILFGILLVCRWLWMNRWLVSYIGVLRLMVWLVGVGRLRVVCNWLLRCWLRLLLI